MNAVIVVFRTAVPLQYRYTLIQNLFISITCLKRFAVLHDNNDVDCLINPSAVTRRKGWTDTQPLQKRKKLVAFWPGGHLPFPDDL